MNKETKTIKIIGLGGIGKALVDPIVQYFSFKYEDVHVTLVDGDSYEEDNRCRQRFTEYGNKAAVTVQELSGRFPNVHFRTKKKYVDDDNVIGLLREGDIVFSCVDNHATRKVISDRCEELDNVTLISGGNDYHDGNVILYRRVNGEDVGRPPTKLFEEIANPTDQNPAHADETSEGCDEIVDSEPQLLFTNNQIAATMCNVYYAVQEGKADFEQVYVDILTQRSRPTPENNVYENIDFGDDE